ncbi:MAG: alpha/beta hydrolase fold domain-containing protein [Clostridia bacterium]|nr:alpha/beta hydrolase fold domain-containing protein [Clostridia bacterium]
MSRKAELMKSQLNMIKPLIKFVPLPLERLWQNKLGDIIRKDYSRKVKYTKVKLKHIECEFVTPKDIRKDIVILYLHGGGFCVGDIEYARGFASALAAHIKCKTMCVEYRLAPHHKFPCALLDVLDAYKYLISNGYTEDKIFLCGESAGGGLCYSLCLKLKKLGKPLPKAVITISPWIDLTLQSSTYELNKDNDPSLTYEKLQKYAEMYTDTPKNPLASPRFARSFKGMPKNMTIVSNNELLLGDSNLIHSKYIKEGIDSTLVITPNMWHAYVVNGVPESKKDLAEIDKFIMEVMCE